MPEGEARRCLSAARKSSADCSSCFARERCARPHSRATVVMAVLAFVEGESGKTSSACLVPHRHSRGERVDSTILALRNDLHRIHYERGAVRLPLPSLLAALDGRQLRLELFDLAQLRLNFVGVYTRLFRRRLF